MDTAKTLPGRQVHRQGWFRRTFGRDWALGYALLVPLALVLFFLLAYPIFVALRMTFQDKVLGMSAEFIGFKNYTDLLFHDQFFWSVVRNGLVFTIGSVSLKLVIGMAMALVLNRPIVARGFFRGLLLMPWVAPTVVSALAWRWMLDLQGVVNYLLQQTGIIQVGIPWLARPETAMLSLVLVNAWRGFAFFGVTLLAGLQTISQELYEAAEVDGASSVQRFRHITLPGLRTVILVATTLSTIWTFNDFNIVWLLTRGGPGNRTDVFATYTYKLAFESNRFGYGQTVTVLLAPVLIIFIMVLSPLMLRGENE